jgi:hypothetical protein
MCFSSNGTVRYKINKFAGRTYNDLGQYPVFPWVIADYSSRELNVNDVNAFRNLNIPIGPSSDDRLSGLCERLAAINNRDDHFLYQALYPSRAVVVGYLIRLEP